MKLTLSFLALLIVSLAISAVLVSRQSLSSIYATPKADASQSSERGPVRMIRFVLSNDGLYPRQMRVDHGLVNVALEDRTGGSDGLVIDSVAGDERVRIAHIARVEKHWRGRGLFRLAPGRYVVSDASQPTHKAELIVNP